MKMLFFFMAEKPIPWAFRLCGIFQFACDLLLGGQYLAFGSPESTPPPAGAGGAGMAMGMGQVVMPAALADESGAKRDDLRLA